MDDEPLIDNKSEVEKDELPIWCEGCNQQGFIFVDDVKKPAFVVCHRCGFEASQLWCPKCEMGGDFVSNIDDRPIYWVCPNCKMQYVLPDNFYEDPVPLYVEKDIPKDIKVKTYPIQRQPFIRLTKKTFPGLLFLFILVVSLALANFSKNSKLQLYALFFIIAISLIYTFIYIQKS